MGTFSPLPCMRSGLKKGLRWLYKHLGCPGLSAGHHTGSSSASHRTVRVHSDVVVVPLQLRMFSCLPQDVVSSLEQQFTPMMQAEFSVLVDVLHSPELLFPEGSDARIRCGAFMSK